MWMLGRLHTHVVASGAECTHMVEFSEHAIVETELRFDRKLYKANLDQSEDDGKLQASRPRWEEHSKQCSPQP